MATAKRIFSLLILATILFQGVSAAVADKYVNTPFPPEYQEVIRLFSSEWPAYTMGMFYFFLLMAFMVGIIYYTGLSKAKIFGGEHYGGAASGINVAMSAIFTLITIKFLPFAYYFFLAVILIPIGIVVGTYGMLSMATKFVGAEGRAGKSLTSIILGIVLGVFGFIMQSLIGQFESFGARLPGELVGAVGIISWVAIGAGVLFGVGGVIFLASSAKWPTIAAGKGGEKAAEMNALEDTLQEGANEKRSEEFSRDAVERLTRAEIALGQGNIKLAENELKAAAKDMKDKIAYYKKVRNEAKAALQPLRGLDQDALSKKGYDITEAQRDAWIRELEKFETFIANANTHLIKLGMEEERGLWAIAKALRKNRGEEARSKLEAFKASIRSLEQQEEKLEEVINKAKAIIQQLEAHPSMAARGAAPAGGAGQGAPPPVGVH